MNARTIHHMIHDPLEQEFSCKNLIQKWAAENALKLIVWSIFGIIGWLLILTGMVIHGG